MVTGRANTFKAVDPSLDDLRAAVVVPARPGPLVRLDHVVAGGRPRDEVDEVIDEVFGTDDRGPGVADAVLVAGGAGAVVVAQLASWPTIVTVAGAAAAALGAVLPARAVLRRLAGSRRRRAVRAVVGDGTVLRTDHAAVTALVAEHDRLRESTIHLAAVPKARVDEVAHSALTEVASLLQGRSPTSAAEVDYVLERVRALGDLRSTLADPRVGDGEHERRRALVEARREVERLSGGSSVNDADELARALLGDDAS